MTTHCTVVLYPTETVLAFLQKLRFTVFLISALGAKSISSKENEWAILLVVAESHRERPPAVIGPEAGCTLIRLPVNHMATQERKPEYSEGTHAFAGRPRRKPPKRQGISATN